MNSVTIFPPGEISVGLYRYEIDSCLSIQAAASQPCQASTLTKIEKHSTILSSRLIELTFRVLEILFIGGFLLSIS